MTDTFLDTEVIEELLQSSGITSIDSEAIDEICSYLEEHAIRLSNQAKILTEFASRSKITKNDMVMAIKF